MVRVDLVKIGRQTTEAQELTLGEIKYLIFLTSPAAKLNFVEIWSSAARFFAQALGYPDAETMHAYWLCWHGAAG